MIKFDPQSFFSKDFVGIDISDRSLELVQLKKSKGNVSISSRSRVKLPEGLVLAGVPKKKEALVMAVRELQNNAKPEALRDNEVILGLSGSVVYTHASTLSKEAMGKLGLERFATTLGRTHIPIEQSKASLAFKKIGTGQASQVIVAGADKNTLALWGSIFDAAGLEVKGVDIPALAAVRGMFGKDAPPAFCLVDVGSERTDVAIFNGQTLAHTYTIEASASTIAKALAKSGEIRGRGAPPEPHTAKVFKDAVAVIVNSLKETLEYYKDSGGLALEMIALYGGAVLLPGLKEQTEETLGIKVRYARSFLDDPEEEPAPVAKKPIEVKTPDLKAYTKAVSDAFRELKVDKAKEASADHFSLYSKASQMALSNLKARQRALQLAESEAQISKGKHKEVFYVEAIGLALRGLDDEYWDEREPLLKVDAGLVQKIEMKAVPEVSVSSSPVPQQQKEKEETGKEKEREKRGKSPYVSATSLAEEVAAIRREKEGSSQKSSGKDSKTASAGDWTSVFSDKKKRPSKMPVAERYASQGSRAVKRRTSRKKMITILFFLLVILLLFFALYKLGFIEGILGQPEVYEQGN